MDTIGRARQPPNKANSLTGQTAQIRSLNVRFQKPARVRFGSEAEVFFRGQKRTTGASVQISRETINVPVQRPHAAVCALALYLSLSAGTGC
jgi:hypothetical protein